MEEVLNTYIYVFQHCNTQYFSLVKQISQAYYSGGIRTHNLCNSRAVSYQLDYRDCPVARGSSNPMFQQQSGNDIIDVKFASRIKNINFGFLPIYTDVCQHCTLSTSASPVKKHHSELLGWDSRRKCSIKCIKLLLDHVQCR